MTADPTAAERWKPPSERSVVVEGDGLAFLVNGRPVLDGVSVAVRAGELVAVVGPSGTGKSCLLALLAGLSVPDAGSVRLRGRPLDGSDPRLRRSIGLVLQGYGLVALLTVAENVEMALQAVGTDEPASVVSRAAVALERVGMADRADTLVENLSGGQRQRVAVARAVVHEPALVIADEPTAALDPELRAAVTDVLLAEAARGAAVVVATHDPAVVERADSVVRLG